VLLFTSVKFYHCMYLTFLYGIYTQANMLLQQAVKLLIAKHIVTFQTIKQHSTLIFQMFTNNSKQVYSECYGAQYKPKIWYVK